MYNLSLVIEVDGDHLVANALVERPFELHRPDCDDNLVRIGATVSHLGTYDQLLHAIWQVN